MVNSQDDHFQADVITKDYNIGIDCVKNLNATFVILNDHTAFRLNSISFGVSDTSGIGKGGTQYAIHEMARE